MLLDLIIAGVVVVFVVPVLLWLAFMALAKLAMLLPYRPRK